MSLNFGEENSIQAGQSLSMSIRSFSVKDALPQGEDVVLLSERVTQVIDTISTNTLPGLGFQEAMIRKGSCVHIKVITLAVSLLIRIGSPLQTHFLPWE